MNDVPVDGLLGIAVSLVLSAFFSGSETALTSLGAMRARQMMETGGRFERILKLWIERPAYVLTAILIGNNIVNVTASALATDVAEKMLSSAGETAPSWANPVAVAIGVMTLLLLTFGEITPKTFARANAEKVAVAALHLLRIPYWIFYPATLVFVKMSRLIARLTRSKLGHDGPFVREEDIAYLVEIGSREGSLSEERRELLASVFDFTETSAREVMVPRTDVVFLSVDTDRKELLETIIRCGHSRLPVHGGDPDDLLGLFYAKDLLRHFANSPGPGDFQLRRFLRRANFVPETKPISELLREMQEERIHMVVVVDEFGGTAGIVTLEDIIEEFFGEIQDEYDAEEELWQLLDEGVWSVDARIDLEELEVLLGIEFDEHGEFESLGGFIAKETGEVADRDTEIVAFGHRFVVEDADERRIKRVRIEPLATEFDTTSESEDDELAASLANAGGAAGQ